jgi:hypothetical protein
MARTFRGERRGSRSARCRAPFMTPCWLGWTRTDPGDRRPCPNRSAAPGAFHGRRETRTGRSASRSCRYRPAPFDRAESGRDPDVVDVHGSRADDPQVRLDVEEQAFLAIVGRPLRSEAPLRIGVRSRSCRGSPGEKSWFVPLRLGGLGGLLDVHCESVFNGSACNSQMTVRPCFLQRMRFADSKVRRCSMNAASVIPGGGCQLADAGRDAAQRVERAASNCMRQRGEPVNPLPIDPIRSPNGILSALIRSGGARRCACRA